MISYILKKRTQAAVLSLAACPALLCFSIAQAQTVVPGQEGLSSEIDFDTPGFLVADHQALIGVETLTIVGLDNAVDLDALIRVSEGQTLFSLDTAATLPGDILVMPGDLVSYAGASFAIVFDASVNDIPDGVNLDAAAANYGGTGALALSFDSTVNIDGLIADDEDLLLWDGSVFSEVVDLSATGVVEALDLDSAHYDAATDTLIVSFDGSGNLAGLDFDDEDLVAWNLTSSVWAAVADVSESVGDVDAYWAAPSDLIFASGTE